MNDSDAPLLTLRNIEKRFPGVLALDQVSFDVRAGEVHALLGENGAGKSTLIKIVSGVYQPDSGEMILSGEQASFTTPAAAQARGIATIYQELLLYPELSVAENIFMGHAPKNRFGAIDWQRMRTLAAEQLASLDIHDLDVDQPVGSLSVGNRQRVEIAKALSQDARVLIMDEPTATLTGSDVEKLFRIVKLLRERSVGVIYISHRLEEIFELADRVTVLRDGACVGTQNIAEVTEDSLITQMVGRTIDDLFPKQNARIGEPVLEVKALSCPPLTREVNLTLRRGEILGLAGLVGSGRSELAQVIFGITPARSGSISINGVEQAIDSPSTAISHGIAYVPEDRSTQGLIKPMTVRENISLAVLRRLSRGTAIGGSVFGGTLIDFAAERELADHNVDKFQVRTHSIEQVVDKLSGGNQQKIVLGKWMASDPTVLIMDEPTRGIDVGAKAEIHRTMSTLAANGMAVLMISSELPEIMGMSDTIAVMREGRLVARFNRGEASQEQIASAMMGTEKPVSTGAGPADRGGIDTAANNINTSGYLSEQSAGMSPSDQRGGRTL